MSSRSTWVLSLALPLACACAAEIGSSELAEDCTAAIEEAASCADLSEEDQAEMVASCMDQPEGLSQVADELDCSGEDDDLTVQFSAKACNPYARACGSGMYCHATLSRAYCKSTARAGQRCSRTQFENTCTSGTCQRYCDVYDCDDDDTPNWIQNLWYGSRCSL